MIQRMPRLARVLLLAVLVSQVCGSAHAGVEVIGVQYVQDKYFSEDYCLWHDRQYPGPCSINLNTGQVVKVFLRNTGASSISVNDVTLSGRSLSHDIRQVTQGENLPSSIYFANLSAGDLQTDVSAGEPVWYKADPPAIPAGGVGQAVLRLRVLPVTQPISMGVVTSGGTVTTNVAVDVSAPVLASAGFSPDRTKVYLHWRRNGGAAPTAILMDGNDVTANATTVGDPALNFGATVLQFATPLGNMSYHVYQGVFADGKKATGALRTWVNPFLYGTWAAKPTSSGDAAGQAWVNEATAHGVNVVVMNVASDGLADLMSTPSGRQWMDDHGYGVVKDDPASASQILRMWFIRDEPDGAEGNVSGLPAGAGHNPGVLAMSAIARGEVLRAAKTDVPVTVNIDGNLKPYNYWNWGQVPDVFMTDPYYQPELADAYLNNTAQIPLYAKATQVYATARTAGLACEPNPLHVILYSCKQSSSSVTWPFPAPGTKRTEVYYALAGGAKGLAYWWYKTPDGLAYGNADALALWKEIGLLGNEIKTAQPLLVRSHPVSLPTTPSSGLWVRTLAVGTDSMIFLVVNDNHYNDVSGCHYTPIENASVSATLPSWLASSTAFEITPAGVVDAGANVNGTQMQLSLGTLNLTRMIVVTTDPQLRAAIQNRYVQQAWPGICQIAPEYCTPQTVAPSIVVQPSSRTVSPGGTASFALAASGTSPLYCRWQKNNTQLTDGGHYSGSTNATLTISNADNSDAASYRCVVTNTYGSVTSSVAVLTITTNQPCNPILNSGFEDGFTLYVGSNIGNNWNQWSSVPDTITGYDEPSVVHSGANSQRIRLWNTAGGTSYAGVYQQIAVQAGAVYTNSVWMYAYDTSSYCYLGVDPTGGTDPTSGSIVWSTGYNGQAWVQQTWTGTATADYLTVFYRVRATDNLKRNGYFDDGVVTCPGGSVSPSITQQPSNRTVGTGGSTTFSILASGSSPLTYRWQQNQTNLSDGGHYTGCSTDTLEINGADTNDVASYRCIVTNTYGSTTSSPVTLTLVGGCTTPTLLNGSFESSSINGVSTNWTAYQRAPNPAITLWSIQTANPPTGGGSQYQQIANTNSTGGGGVRQDVTGCAIGATYQVSGWMRGNSLSATCTVKVSPSASTAWASAIDLNPRQTYSGASWTAFSGTVIATGTNMTLWLDGQTTGTKNFNAECFDMVSVSCVAGPPAAPTAFDVTGGGAGCAGVGVSVGLSSSQPNVNYSLSRNGTTTVATLTGTGAALSFGLQTTAGTYTVAATNATVPSVWAGMTGTADVTILPRPTSLVSGTATICNGSSTTISAALTGSGPWNVIWSDGMVQNGVASSPATRTVSPTATTTYTVTDLTDANCTAQAADRTGGALVTVKAATTVTEQPLSAVLAVGGTTNLNVAATGDGTLSYQWQANQTNINNGGHYSGCTTATLTLSNADTNDTASYRCVVTGGCGSATSSNATVTCVAPVPSLAFVSAVVLSPDQISLVLTGTPGSGVTLWQSSDLMTWLLLTNLINTNGTLQFTDTPTTNTPERFYHATSP
jgi:hypothetical protein